MDFDTQPLPGAPSASKPAQNPRPQPHGAQRVLKSLVLQAELAAALGVSRQTIISIENGRYLPSLPLAFGIARFFDLTVDKMFDPDEEEAGA